MGLSSRQVASAIGVTHTAINKAARSGRIPKEPDGTFDLEKVRAAWRRNADQLQRQRRAGNQKPPRTAETAGGDSEGSEGNSDSFFEAQRRREWLRVAKEELELEVRRGKLVLAEDVAATWAAVIGAIRNRILLLPSKLSPRVASVTDVRECEAIIEREVRKALADLAETELPA